MKKAQKIHIEKLTQKFISERMGAKIHIEKNGRKNFYIEKIGIKNSYTKKENVMYIKSTQAQKNNRICIWFQSCVIPEV
jgi:hypothetical protein